MTRVSHGQESLEIEWPEAEGWVIGHQQDIGHTAIVEVVRPPETVHNWTQLGTMMVFRDDIGKWMATHLDDTVNRLFEGAKTRAQEANLDARPERLVGPFDSRIFIIVGKGYPDGTSETQVQLLVQGRNVLYNIQRTQRTSQLDRETVEAWVRFLQTARVISEQAR
ncbi:MAG: hypothetical protein HYZ96_02885 [Candidatus Omnitrophica bacterium]|nr:hypothetical protein [Candidatus Omnitrophota bacterium]